MMKKLGLTAILAGALLAGGCTVGDVYQTDAMLARRSGNPMLGVLLNAAGREMNRQEEK